MSRGRRLAYAAIIVVASVALDQASKEWALNKLENGRTIDVLPTVEFDLAFNSGFSFSTGSGRGNLVALLVIALCIFIGWQIWRESRPVRAFLYAVILGGAIGNLLDRVFRADDGFLSGEVIDFIDVSWYAVFNVADIFVVCGCVAFVIHELLSHRSERATQVTDADSDDAESTSPSGAI
jgi:signal peptidase II